MGLLWEVVFESDIQLSLPSGPVRPSPAWFHWHGISKTEEGRRFVSRWFVFAGGGVLSSLGGWSELGFWLFCFMLGGFGIQGLVLKRMGNMYLVNVSMRIAGLRGV